MNRKGWLAGIALGCIVVAMGTFVSVGDAGLGGALKKKLDKVTKQAEDKANQTGDKVSGDGDEATTPGADQSADKGGGAGAAGGGKVSTVSTKFDFVPGDSVMFVDDFSQDELGEFPARWKLAQGTFEVAELGGERWLRCVSADGHVRMKLPAMAAMPPFWTLEFDGTQLDGAGNTLTVTGLTNSGETVWETTFPYAGTHLFFRSGAINSDTPFESGAIAGRHHIMFMARGAALKVYVDRDRMASVPDVSGAGTPSEIDIRLWSTQKPMIANVRFAEGCKPAQDMLDSGKLVTYGIRFPTGSDVVLPESAPVLRQVSAYLQKHADVKLRVTGHTDNVGAAAGNLDLSKRRAAAVARVLSDQFAIAADRFVTDGKGDTQPVASNAKPEGKAMNRRVEFARM